MTKLWESSTTFAMEPSMYTAIVRMVEQKKLDEVVSKTANERKMSAKRIQPFEVIEDYSTGKCESLPRMM